MATVPFAAARRRTGPHRAPRDPAGLQSDRTLASAFRDSRIRRDSKLPCT